MERAPARPAGGNSSHPNSSQRRHVEQPRRNSLNIYCWRLEAHCEGRKENDPQFKQLQYETGMFRNEQNGACREH